MFVVSNTILYSHSENVDKLSAHFCFQKIQLVHLVVEAVQLVLKYKKLERKVHKDKKGLKGRK